MNTTDSLIFFEERIKGKRKRRGGKKRKEGSTINSNLEALIISESRNKIINLVLLSSPCVRVPGFVVAYVERGSYVIQLGRND